ncbi:MAG TPA: hypothetical protein VJU60_12820 [Thermoleophilaceae bacterium]|nr:hypothetical protein [Thermoleophilaceae bacterium]
MSEQEHRRSLVERRIVRSGVDESREGKPLSRRARQTRRTVEAYLAAGVMPRYMERLREIEAERANLRRRIGRAYRALKETCGDDREAFARRWRERAHEWSFDEINQLIKEHNDWYPIESGLPLDPRTRDYVPIRGRSYRRTPLGPDWVLENFPAEI